MDEFVEQRCLTHVARAQDNALEQRRLCWLTVHPTRLVLRHHLLILRIETVAQSGMPRYHPHGGEYRREWRPRGGGRGRGHYGRNRRNHNFDDSERRYGARSWQQKRARVSGGQERPPVVGLASSQLVQLLVRVADVDARRTTDSGTSLTDNLRALSSAAAEEVGTSPDRVATLLCLVARSSPLGIKAFGVLGALLARQHEGFGSALARAVGGAISDAFHKGRRLDARLTLRLWCEFAARGVLDAPRTLLNLLAEAATQSSERAVADAAASMLVACRLTTAMDDHYDGALSEYVTGARGRDALVVGIEAILTDASLPHADNLTDWDEGLDDNTRDAALPCTVPLEELESTESVVDGLRRMSGLETWPTLPGLSNKLAITQTERFWLSSLAIDTCSAFRPGARWDGIVVGDRAQLAKQLLGLSQLLRDPDVLGAEDLLSDVVVSLACIGAPGPSDGALAGEHAIAPYGSLDALHVALELCRESPSSFAPKLADRIELVFRDMDEVDYCNAARLAKWFALFLNNTNFVWPYWQYWSDAVEEAPEYDAQRRFLVALFDHVVRLSYVDRLKCAPNFPPTLHAYIPPSPEPDIDQAPTDPQAAKALSLALEVADCAALADALDDEDESDTPVSMPLPLAVAFTDLDDALRCATATRAALILGRATVSHTFAALDHMAQPLAALARGNDDCEAACLEAIATVWSKSTFHVALCADALVRRGVLRPRALVAFVLRDDAGRWALAELTSSTAPLELIDLAVDRSLDLVAAALHAAPSQRDDNDEDDILGVQIHEASEVCLDIFAALVHKLDIIARRGDDNDEQDEAWSAAALSVLADLAARYDRAQRGKLETTRRSSPARAVPEIFDSSRLKTTVIHDGIHPKVKQQLQACFLTTTS